MPSNFAVAPVAMISASRLVDFLFDHHLERPFAELALR